MPPPRAAATELARMLDAVDQPVYAVSEERRIVYYNRAFREWTDAGDELLGQECRYHSSPEAAGPAALAAALCPPPEVFAATGRSVSSTVRLRDGAADESERAVEFVPLAGGSQVGGVVAFVGVAGQPAAANADAAEASAAELHARVARYRRLLGAKYQLGRLVGESLAMKRVRSQVALAATGKASVVVIGPAGSGRQQVARTIHYAQAEAASGPLVPLACPLLGAELLQSTIRALARPKQGERGPLAPQVVDAARLASLLLIDADRLPADAQAELAGFLTLADLPVRIISTTRRPLLELAGQKTFRPDLASLLSTLVIEIPPLAERLDDLPLLAQWFLEQANSRGPKQVGAFTPEALDRLHGYAWPGGVSELEALVNEAHARAEGHEIMPRDLPPRIDLAAEASARPRKVEEVIVLEEFLGRIERELIERALKRAKGNKTKAARLLGMTRPRLYRRLVQLGLEG